MSIPLRNTQKHVLNMGQPRIQCWVAALKRQRWRCKIWVWKEASSHPQTSQHHQSCWIHASPCVCEAPCAMEGAEYYIHLMIFEFNRVALWSDFGGELSGEWFLLSTAIVMDATILIRHVKGQPSAPFHAGSEVCGVVCMLEPCKHNLSVLLMHNLLSLSFLWWHHSSSKKTRWVWRSLTTTKLAF